jgi:hypothetical protein
MNLEESAEQRQLRESVHRFLADRAPLPRVRELMEAADATDVDVWRQADRGDGSYHRERLAARIGL